MRSSAPLGFALLVTVCGRAELGTRDEGVCGAVAPIVDGLIGRICVHQQGIVPSCPDAYPSRSVVASGVSDDRDCECSCTADGATGEIRFLDDDACTQCGADETCGAIELDDASSCLDELPDVGDLHAKWVGAECNAEGVPTGIVVDAELFTFCCL